ncbi:hypothetical protein BB559_002788 [Furculomyces boomerangus]|uniref:RING-type domain-containing protein n=2 Tax=Harpellales TaxID=61421 RepID=A0A2T9YSK5_9FUNG|nr:hypothetical protein BB559_002788 [Furculomyces boomerangus]PVZ98588.1 hypothetical protein BB558_005402 [Smittium angustum]
MNSQINSLSLSPIETLSCSNSINCLLSTSSLVITIQPSVQDIFRIVSFALYFIVPAFIISLLIGSRRNRNQNSTEDTNSRDISIKKRRTIPIKTLEKYPAIPFSHTFHLGITQASKHNNTIDNSCLHHTIIVGSPQDSDNIETGRHKEKNIPKLPIDEKVALSHSEHNSIIDIDQTSINKDTMPEANIKTGTQTNSSPNHDHQDKKEDDDSDVDCLICFDTINPNDLVRSIPCKHVFHQECLDIWLTTRSCLCPICRYDLLINNDDALARTESTSDINIIDQSDNIAQNRLPQTIFPPGMQSRN